METAPPQNAPRVFALFFACALVAYALNILSRHIEWWGWVQFFAPSAALLLPGLTAGVLLGHKLRWLSVQATAGRYLSAAVIVAASFPLATGFKTSFTSLHSEPSSRPEDREF